MQGPRCDHICFGGKKFPNGAASSPGMAHCGGGPALDHFEMLTTIGETRFGKPT
jgi:hypothetical protein